MSVGGGLGDRESGQISILLLGMVTLALSVVLAVVGVTSVQLARIHLLDAADAAALDASDALAREIVYAEGLGAGVPLSDETVVTAASEHLASRTMPGRISGWSVAPGTGTPDGRTAVVAVTGVARVPVLGRLLDQFGTGVRITMTSTARSDLVP